MRVEIPHKRFMLKDGSKVDVRALKPAEGPALVAFLRELPEEDRLFLRSDVMKSEFEEHYLHGIDYNKMIPIVAFVGDKIVANATLYRTDYGWTTHVGQIRVAVARPFQRKGLGRELIDYSLELAINMGLDKLIAEVVDNQISAKSALERSGFHAEATLKNHVKDIHGRRRNLVIMSNDLSHIWESMETLASSFHPSME